MTIYIIMSKSVIYTITKPNNAVDFSLSFFLSFSLFLSFFLSFFTLCTVERWLPGWEGSQAHITNSIPTKTVGNNFFNPVACNSKSAYI